MTNLNELTLSVESAKDLNAKATADVIGTARATIARWRETSEVSGTMLVILAAAVDLQRETEHRLGLAHAARLDAVMTDAEAR